MLIPETLDGAKLGLVTRYQREYSASPEPAYFKPAPNSRSTSNSNSRESSPFTSGGGRSVSFYDTQVERDIRDQNAAERERRARGGSSTPPPSREQKELKVGDRVIVRSAVGEAKTGVLKFLGPVEFEEGKIDKELIGYG